MNAAGDKEQKLYAPMTEREQRLYVALYAVTETLMRFYAVTNTPPVFDPATLKTLVDYGVLVFPAFPSYPPPYPPKPR